MRLLLLVILTLIISPAVFAQKKAPQDKRGLVPELRLQDAPEGKEDVTALKSELMISQSEELALKQLQKLIQQNKNSPLEPDLLYRLAELHMRRAKSGRFFDLQRHEDGQILSLVPPRYKGTTAIQSVNNAISIYEQIQKRYPKFEQMDSVIFNHAFALQQANQEPKATEQYLAIIYKYPFSGHTPETHVALAEIFYKNQKFEQALNHYQAMDKFPNHSLYPFATYKSAWTHYNLKNTQAGMLKLEKVLELSPASANSDVRKHHLRTEALRDMTLFFTDIHPAEKAVSYFAKFSEGQELHNTLMNLAKLYDSYSRHKEVITFLLDYTDKHKKNPNIAEVYHFLTDVAETIKDRPAAVKYLGHLNKSCHKPQPEGLDFCQTKAKEKTLDLAKKWWEIWQKNKSFKEFITYSQTAFELYLGNENQAAPDYKTHLAYADFLFQTEQFHKAWSRYLTVSQKISEPELAHTAGYSALVSMDLAEQKEKVKIQFAEKLQTTQSYLKLFPNGQHKAEVQFKLAHIYYLDKKYVESAAVLKDLVAQNVTGEIAEKSQDLYLDILNQQKDYAAITKVAGDVIKTTQNASRKQNMQKILEEANFAEIRLNAESGNTQKAADDFYKFSSLYPDSPKALDALWNSTVLQVKNQKPYAAAEMALEFEKKSNDKSKKREALLQAIAGYLNTGHLLKAADVLAKLAREHASKTTEKVEFLQSAADLYILESQYPKAEQLLTELNSIDSSNKSKRLVEIYEMYPEKTHATHKAKALKNLVDQSVEPYWSRAQLAELNMLNEQNKKRQAFELARKIVGSNATVDKRAQARLIQAKILEEELVAQSVKAKLDRLEMVLALKTEKLDKATSAYSNVLKLAQDGQLQLAALQGMERSFANYVESIKTLPLPEELPADEAKILRSELLKLSNPIESQLVEVRDKLKSESTRDIAQAPNAPHQSYSLTYQYSALGLENASSSQCPSSIKDISNLSLSDANDNFNRCLRAKNWNQAQVYALHMAENYSQSPTGLYALAVLSASQSQHLKSAWLLDHIYKTYPENSRKQDSFQIQKTKLLSLYYTQNCQNNVKLFSSQERAFLEAEDEISIATSECYAMLGDLKNAQKVVEKKLAKSQSKLLYSYQQELQKSLHVISNYSDKSM